jgi:hypothetical protein
LSRIPRISPVARLSCIARMPPITPMSGITRLPCITRLSLCSGLPLLALWSSRPRLSLRRRLRRRWRGGLAAAKN